MIGAPVDAAAPLVGIVGDAAVRAVVLAGALVELDHVGGVVDDDVHVEFHAARMDRVDQRLEVGVGAEMRIDLGEIGDPIAVIAGAFVPLAALHRLVLEHRRQPDRGRAETLDVIEPLDQALEVAAVVEALRVGSKPVASRSPDRPPRSFDGSPFSNRSGRTK